MKKKKDNEEFEPVKQIGRGGHPSGKESSNYQHGAYCSRLLEQDEFEMYDHYWKKLHEEFDLNNSSDKISADMVCSYYIRVYRAMKADNDEAVRLHDSLLRHHLSMLKASRSSRQGETTNVNINTSPAEWAVDLLERAREEKKKHNRKYNDKKKKEKSKDANNALDVDDKDA